MAGAAVDSAAAAGLVAAAEADSAASVAEEDSAAAALADPGDHGANDTRRTRLAVARGLRHALRSVVLYGSAAAGEHIAKRSDYNVLVIVDALDATRARGRVGGVARVGGRGQSGAAHADDVANGAARRTSFRWSTPTFSSGTRCCSAIRRSTGFASI